jgi:predicted peptidase
LALQQRERDGNQNQALRGARRGQTANGRHRRTAAGRRRSQAKEYHVVDIDRRTFVRYSGAGLLALLGTATPGIASAAPGTTSLGSNHVVSVTAITKVFGDGQKLVAVAVEYDAVIDGSKLTKATFTVAGRTVTGVHTATAPMAGKSATGRYVIVELSLADAAASLYVQIPNSGPGGPPTVGQSTPGQKILAATASLVQSGPVVTAGGVHYLADRTSLTTGRAINPIVDDFRHLSFTDAKTGRTLAYNLFIPKGYDPNKSYPLVLFMHDAGPVNVGPTAPLVQGLGAVCWASPEDQAKHESFVVAPEFPEIVIDDNYKPSTYLEATVNLVHFLTGEYSIDRRRLHTTGQSMGAMLSLGMDIRHPGLFASSFIVAGQWPSAQAKPLAKKRMWVVVSQDDTKAFPMENEIMAVVKQEGTQVAQAAWNGRSTAAEFATDVRRMAAHGRSINYATFKPGTVEPPGASSAMGAGHMDTWHVAYTIPGIRDWIMRQSL